MGNSSNARRGSEVAMRSAMKHFSCKRLAMLCGCVVLSSCLWSQAGSASPSTNSNPAPPEAAAAAGQDTHGAATKPDNTYVIGNDDVLAINVWKEPDITRSVPVRSDGNISLPLVGELQATGRTPLQLEEDISGRLRNYIAEPEVTVMVQEIRSQKFN